mmetsp:Transcript_33332/g.76959  ORF Transcript_33332/g.76959 Transcript_33332/m.76959 type:complete len:351 (-) Transcript_33332:80-1132(-)
MMLRQTIGRLRALRTPVPISSANKRSEHTISEGLGPKLLRSGRTWRNGRHWSSSSEGGGGKNGDDDVKIPPGDDDDGFGVNLRSLSIERNPSFNRLGSPSGLSDVAPVAARDGQTGQTNQDVVEQIVETFDDEKYRALVDKILSRREERAKLAQENAPSQEDYSVIRTMKWGRGVNRTAEDDKDAAEAIEEYLKPIPPKNREKVAEKEGLAYEPLDIVHPMAHDWFMNAGNPFEEAPTPDELNRHKKKPPNRKNAIPLPKDQLHHLNLDILRRYLTPGNQIMSRRQSQLGAKDQRKVAKLIKRARKMGLIPHVGQWKVWDKGAMPQEILRVIEDEAALQTRKADDGSSRA